MIFRKNIYILNMLWKNNFNYNIYIKNNFHIYNFKPYQIHPLPSKVALYLALFFKSSLLWKQNEILSLIRKYCPLKLEFQHTFVSSHSKLWANLSGFLNLKDFLKSTYYNHSNIHEDLSIHGIYFYQSMLN